MEPAPSIAATSPAFDKARATWQQRPKHIALILPLQDSAGKAIQEGFLSAYYAALDVSRDVPKISVFDSSNLSNVYPIYDAAVASGADLIIGPLYKQLVNQLQQLDELPVPTLALNYSDDSINLSSNLTQFGLAPEDEIEQAANLAWQAGYKNAAIITPQSSDYRAPAAGLRQQLDQQRRKPRFSVHIRWRYRLR